MKEKGSDEKITENAKALHSAIDRLEKILHGVNRRLREWCESTVEWFRKRGEALQEGISLIYKIVKNGAKNGANGHRARLERALEGFNDFTHRHSPIDGVILVGLVSVIIGLVIMVRRA